MEQIWTGASVFADNNPLRNIWQQEIFRDTFAWYVDHFTADAEQFGVKYLAPGIFITNEDKTQRDKNNPDDTMWTEDTIKEWFSDHENQTFYYTFILKDSKTEELFGIHCEAGLVFAFGPQILNLPQKNMWKSSYIEHGLLGPLQECRFVKESKLEAIVKTATVKTLAKYGQADNWMFALSQIMGS